MSGDERSVPFSSPVSVQISSRLAVRSLLYFSMSFMLSCKFYSCRDVVTVQLANLLKMRIISQHVMEAPAVFQDSVIFCIFEPQMLLLHSGKAAPKVPEEDRINDGLKL